MKACSKCKVEQEFSEFGKHKGKPLGLTLQCKGCIKEKKREYYLENKEKVKEKVKAYREINPEGVKKRKAAYYKENKEVLDAKNKQNRLDNLEAYTATAKKHYQDNKTERRLMNKAWYEQNKEQASAASSKWKKENKGAVNAYCAKRRAAKLQRKPSWLTGFDELVISELYAQAQLITEDTGVVHHVDHIIPLQGVLVSGLHVPSNLQVITANENMVKNNAYLV